MLDFDKTKKLIKDVNEMIKELKSSLRHISDLRHCTNAVYGLNFDSEKKKYLEEFDLVLLRHKSVREKCLKEYESLLQQYELIKEKEDLEGLKSWKNQYESVDKSYLEEFEWLLQYMLFKKPYTDIM